MENGPHFRHREMTDEFLVVTLTWDGIDPCNLLQRARAFELDVSHERFDRREPQIAGGWAVAAILLNVGQEREDHVSVHMLKHEL